MRVCEAALGRGVFAQAIRPPTVPAGTSRLRLAAMASHTKAELREAAKAIGAAARACGFQPGAAGVPAAPAAAEPRRSVAAPEAPAPAGVFDGEAFERAA